MSADQTTPARRVDRWDTARLVLGLVWVVLLLSALLLREDERSLAELSAQVRAGEVERVELVGGVDALLREFDVPAGTASGSAAVDVRWGGLGDRQVVRLQEVRGDSQESRGDGREVVTDDVASRLQALDRDLVVDRVPSGTGGATSLLGARFPGPVVAVLLVTFLATLYLLVNGPQPWRATRWAWFWLVLVPFGALAFCVLSGRTPGLPAPRTARRLTGGWSFLLASVLGSGTWAGS